MIEEKSRLVIIGNPYRKRYGKQNRTYILVECNHNSNDIPVIFECLLDNFKRGHTKSCGCLNIEKIKSSETKIIKHGFAKHPLYHIWGAMIRRCYNTNIHNYHRYGGRGIIVCDEWKNDFQKFYNWAIKNGWQKGLTIERKNNDGNYCSDNCIFATRKKQANNRSNNHLIVAFGETKTLVEWSEDSRCKVSRATLSARINSLGWLCEDAISKSLCQKGVNYGD